jgi:hypothetical protein
VPSAPPHEIPSWTLRRKFLSIKFRSTHNLYPKRESSSSISLSRDRSIVSSKLSFSVFGERRSSKSYNVVVFPFAFHIAVQQPLKPLWSRLLLCDHEPFQPSIVLCFMSLLMSLLPASATVRSRARIVFPVRTLRSWVRIPLEGWMYVCVFLCLWCPV